MTLEERVVMIVARETGGCCGMETTFDELGVDSLEFLDVVTAVEQETKKYLNDSELGKIKTVGNLVAALENR